MLKTTKQPVTRAYLTIESLGTGYGNWENISQTYANKFRTIVNGADDTKRAELRAQFVRGYLVGNLAVTAGKADILVFEMKRADREAIRGGLNKDGSTGTYESAYQRATHRWSDTFGNSVANAGTKHARAKANRMTISPDQIAALRALDLSCATKAEMRAVFAAYLATMK